MHSCQIIPRLKQGFARAAFGLIQWGMNFSTSWLMLFQRRMIVIRKSTNFCPTVLFASYVLSYPFECLSQEIRESDYPYSFQQIQAIDGVRRQVFADLDGDGNEEIISTTVEEGPLVNDFDGPNAVTACHIAGFLKVGEFQALDFNGDLAPEIFLPIKQDNQIWLEVWNVAASYGRMACTLILKTEPTALWDNSNDGEFDGRLIYFEAADINKDGQKDILAGLDTGDDKRPRGILAFDGKTGKKLWEFSLAGRPFSPVCADLNGDGKKEILIGTWAPCNKDYYPGDTLDCKSYLICLTIDGELLWQHVMGGEFSSTHYILDDIDEDGEVEIICTFATGDGMDKSTRFELQIRNGKTGEVVRYFRLPTGFGHPFLADLDNDAKNEILVSNGDGCIYVFNADLDVVNKCQLGTDLESYSIGEIVDINQNGSLEIIAIARNKLVILDSQLDIFGKYKSNMMIRQAHYFRHPYYGGLISLTQFSRAGLKNSVLLQIHRSSELQRIVQSAQKKHGIVFLTAIFLSGMVSMLLVLKAAPIIIRKMHQPAHLRLEAHRNRLLETLTAFGHGKTATRNLDRLCFLFKNLPADAPLSLEYKKRIDETLTAYFGLISQQVNEIAKKAQAAEIGNARLESLQKNSRKLENLLNTYYNRGTMQSQAARIAREIPAIVECINGDIEAIQNELALYYSSDIIVVVERVLAAASPRLREEDISFKNFHAEGDLDAKGFIDKTDFVTVFNDVLDNAIIAMQGCATKELAATVFSDERKIFVEVVDSGCGIKNEDIDRIFDLEFSTKKEGGFGLYHAKETLNKYGGKIKVTQSIPGKGTSVRLEIRRV